MPATPRQRLAILQHSILVSMLLLLDSSCTLGAAIIEDQTSTWEMAGLGDYFARVTDDILPLGMVERMTQEIHMFEKREEEDRLREQGGGSYMHGKKGTFYRPLFDAQGEFLKPRFAIEAAIQMIYKSDIGEYRHERVAGAEWWVQHRSEAEDISFHHDKDEALASLKMTMQFPEVSTVTYLTDIGAPTLIFNQTSKDGNEEVPIIPSRGFLSYPKKNRHLLFRGNLQHGVPGKLAIPFGGSGGVGLRSGVGGQRRITFLINWWSHQPLGPNCRKVDNKMVKSMGLYDKEGMAELVRSDAFMSHRPTHGLTSELAVPPKRSDRHRIVVELAGFDSIWFDLPKDMKKGAWRIEWADDQIFGFAAKLDLGGNMVKSLFNDRRTKVIIFLANSEEHEEATEYALPLAKRHLDTLKFVFADAKETQNAMKAFGLELVDLPTAVLHQTHPFDKKYLMPVPKGKREEIKAGRLSEESLSDMVKLYFGGKLGTMGGNDASNDDEL